MNHDHDLAELHHQALRFEQLLGTAIIGQERAIRLITLALFARGHVLLEGGVGVGKTTLLRAVARAVGGDYERIEGAIDLMPNDLIYYTYLDEAGKPAVSPGPLLRHEERLTTFFFNEINRARPQVHALLLRVMAEHSLAAFNREFHFPHLQVFADRNRVEKEETFELPAAARDRFMLEIPVEVPGDDRILDRLMTEPRFHHPDRLIAEVPEAILDYRNLNRDGERLQQQIQVSERLRAYVLDLGRATAHPESYGISLAEAAMDEVIEAGASPRGMSFLLRLARVHAWLNGRDRVLPEDVQGVFGPAMSHRIFLKPVYEYQRAALVPELIQRILRTVAAP
ncbi:MAG: MoxR family ATPase [Methylococcaceae bacterium]|nr:MoxR family ATPase [Methylococcaceae bacterium]